MLEFQLFRIKVYLSIITKKGRSEVLKESILSSPVAEFRKGMTWHIGNISPIEEMGLYFRVGRTSTSKFEVYQNGNFTDQDFEIAPYTHALLDFEHEIIAIANKVKLAPRVIGIANNLINLLNQAPDNRSVGNSFEIDAILDPDDFLMYLRKAYSVSKFWVRFARPNPWDVNEDFIKPTQETLVALNGETGKTVIEGENLTTSKLEDIARSAAATGDDAGASVKMTDSSPKIKRRLKGNPVYVEAEDILDATYMKTLLLNIRNRYQAIRKGNKTDAK